jgi:hypothetical protein
VALLGDPDIGIRELMITLQEYYFDKIDFDVEIELNYPPGPITTQCRITDISEFSKSKRMEYYKTCDDIFFVFSAVRPSSFRRIDQYYEEMIEINPSLKFGLICMNSEIYKNTQKLSEKKR